MFCFLHSLPKHWGHLTTILLQSMKWLAELNWFCYLGNDDSNYYSLKTENLRDNLYGSIIHFILFWHEITVQLLKVACWFWRLNKTSWETTKIISVKFIYLVFLNHAPNLSFFVYVKCVGKLAKYQVVNRWGLGPNDSDIANLLFWVEGLERTCTSTDWAPKIYPF